VCTSDIILHGRWPTLFYDSAKTFNPWSLKN
jgi:hypothetical protein